MWESVITAGVLSLLGGLVGQPPPRYRFWRQWAPRRFALCIGIYLLCHAALGVVVALLADQAQWRPFDGDWFLAGLAFALAGQGLIRVAPQSVATDVTNARTLFSRFIEFTVELLDTGCEDKIEAALEALPGESIAAQATWMYERFVVQDDHIPPNARAVSLDALEKAADELEADNFHLAGRGTLERFCIRLFMSRELLPRSLRGKAELPRGEAASPRSKVKRFEL